MQEPEAFSFFAVHGCGHRSEVQVGRRTTGAVDHFCPDCGAIDRFERHQIELIRLANLINLETNVRPMRRRPGERPNPFGDHDPFGLWPK